MRCLLGDHQRQVLDPDLGRGYLHPPFDVAQFMWQSKKGSSLLDVAVTKSHPFMQAVSEKSSSFMPPTLA
jgi:hypothetical protein